MTESKQHSWYAGNHGCGHQGTVICEQTGRTIAVVYDSDDTDLLAAAPVLADALRECITDDGAQCIVTGDVAYLVRRLRAINRIARQTLATVEHPG